MCCYIYLSHLGPEHRHSSISTAHSRSVIKSLGMPEVGGSFFNGAIKYTLYAVSPLEFVYFGVFGTHMVTYINTYIYLLVPSAYINTCIIFFSLIVKTYNNFVFQNPIWFIKSYRLIWWSSRVVALWADFIFFPWLCNLHSPPFTWIKIGHLHLLAVCTRLFDLCGNYSILTCFWIWLQLREKIYIWYI